MANRETGAVELISRERIYTVRFSLEAIINLEETFGSIEEAGKAIQTNRVGPLVDFLQCGLENPEASTGRFTRSEVLAIVEGMQGRTPLDRVGAAVKIAVTAFQRAFPEAQDAAAAATPEEEGGENAGAEKRRKNSSAPTADSTGRKSSASATGR